ncbi:Der GTPase-activating protein YihI [Shewanella psychrotolerans]|uniref:Der GTPase-activating protein YihI n=1 Tax=Shewanella psychrotolerans TaxID=2864206 RepID=UPI001C65AC25|nr:Der GTPase-activating protein YihI [Shewanella psychrotolerans]QYK01317.1 Der GTPase-activating protein YihI [Shewanella psychrotolerans]
MSRKKTRKINENAPKRQPRTKKEERVVAGKKQNAGNKAGSRHNEKQIQQAQAGTAKAKDPRHGSKKPVALDLPKAKPVESKPKAPKMSDEQKLLKLEDDPRLNSLLDMLEEGKTLNTADQTWLEKQLTEIERLMERLGISEEDDLEHVMKTTVSSDDDLLDKFESGADLLKDYQNRD